MRPILNATFDGLCALDLSTLNVPVSRNQALKILRNQGFKRVDVNIGDLARSRIDHTRYRRHARQDQAPKSVDCKTFVVWLYEQIGIRLSTVSLFESGCLINQSYMKMGDLIFVTDKTAPSGRHVGMAIDHEYVIHAQQRMDINLEHLDSFVRKGEEIVRIVRCTNIDSIVTFKCPLSKSIQCSSDIESVIRKAYNRQKNPK